MRDPYDDPPEDPSAGPPHSLAAEQGILGLLLQHPALVADISTYVTAGDFYNTRNEIVFNAITTLAARGQVADHVTVISYLAGDRVFTASHGHQYLLELRDPSLVPEQLPAYCQIVRDAARLRDSYEAAQRIIAAVSRRDLDSVNSSLEVAVDTISDAAARFGPNTTADAPTGLRDLSFLLEGTWPENPPPVYGQVSGDGALFYAGRVNGLFGDPETSKTWLACWAGLDAIDSGELFALIDVDHNGVDLSISRLLKLGAKPEHLADPTRFRYYEPDDAVELVAAINELVARRPGFVILDSIGEILPMLGVKSVDNDEISAALRRIANPLADTGACVVTIDHLPKGHEARASGYAIGGTAKKRAMDGALIHCEVRLAPAPGQYGKVTLRIEKDRVGELRRACHGRKYIGDFHLDSRDPDVTRAWITRGDSPAEGGHVSRPTYLMEQVSRLVEDMPDITASAIEKTIRGKALAIRIAVQLLTEEVYITSRTGPRKATLYTSVKPYRQADDEPPEETF